MSVSVVSSILFACGGGAPHADCHGLVPTDRLPARVGGFEFGEVHRLPGGGEFDLTGFSGCRFPDGSGVVVLYEGRFASAYHLDCEHLTLDDLPDELLPTDGWLCYGPEGGLERSAPSLGR